MQWLTIHVFLLTQFFFKVTHSASEFNLHGDYLLGGLFPLHGISSEYQSYPTALECYRYSFHESSYRMFEMMRFAVEEINNSSTLLPNVSLGYEIFDHCSTMQNFPSVLSFISENGSIPVQRYLNKYKPKVIAMTGPFGSTQTIALAPVFMINLIPMVNYGASSHDLSNNKLFPSFLRSVPSNKHLVDIIIHIIKWFGWNWVAFVGGQDDYSENGLQFFSYYSKRNNICLAYQELLGRSSDYVSTLEAIEKKNIKVIVVFSPIELARNFIKIAIAEKVRNKVWIASEAWSMSKQIRNEPGIQSIGNVFGITEKLMSFRGFDQFIYNRLRNSNAKHWQSRKTHRSGRKMCNQVCQNCSFLSPEGILNEDPTFDFAICSAMYTMAHALHKVLQCDSNSCNKTIPVYPFKLLKEMKTLDFPLNGRNVKYDRYGDPSVLYDVVFWHLESSPPVVERIGTYSSYPEVTFTINNSLIGWNSDASIPFANCSAECEKGYRREIQGNYACCFQCKICEINTYVNYTYDPYTCKLCKVHEWSGVGSTSCKKRVILYPQHTSLISIFLLVSATALLALCVAVILLFFYSYDTPIVKSAGGNMCFVMLASLALSTISVFFFLGEPTVIHCIFRNVLFNFFYTVCLSCMTVRSFQIFLIFKMANKFPKIQSFLVQHNGQWIVITTLSSIQMFISVLWMGLQTPVPDKTYIPESILLICSIGNEVMFFMSVILTWFLSVLCFSFSYMSTDLPKNYNEAKSIAFSMLLFFISWSFLFTVSNFPIGLYIHFFNAGTQLTSVYGILLSYFIPKSYIIIFHPEKNTQAAFQTSIQNYTQTMSRM